MSHLATLQSKIADLDALQNAVQKFGLTLTPGGKVRFYYGSSEPVDHLLALPGKYDLGFKLAPDGTYKLVADSEVFSTGPYALAKDAHKILGPGCRDLFQEYTYEVFTKTLALQGQSVTRQTLDDGRLELLVDVNY